MGGRTLEEKKGEQNIELIPRGIDILVVEPERLVEMHRDTLVDDLLRGKITSKAVTALEAWDGHLFPYDGVIVICDQPLAVIDKMRKMGRMKPIERNNLARILIISSNGDEAKTLLQRSHVLQSQLIWGSHDIDIVSPEELAGGYNMSKFIASVAYQKLVPGGRLGEW